MSKKVLYVLLGATAMTFLIAATAYIYSDVFADTNQALVSQNETTSAMIKDNAPIQSDEIENHASYDPQLIDADHDLQLELEEEVVVAETVPAVVEELLDSSVMEAGDLEVDESIIMTDVNQILEFLGQLAEKEIAAVGGVGWHHTSYSFYTPEAGRTGATRSQQDDTQVQTEQLIPDIPLSESFVKINSDQEIIELIGVIRDETTGEFTQVNIWDGEALVHLHLKNAGFPENEYKANFTPSIQLFTQSRFAELQQWKDSEGVFMLLESTGDTTSLLFGSEFGEPQEFAGIAQPVKTIETTDIYNTVTGKLLSSTTYAVTESGDKHLLSKTNVHKQEFISELPEEIRLLYVNNGFTIE